MTTEHPLAAITRRIDAAMEALRLSYIALLSAACLAEEHGDKKAVRFYDKQAQIDRLVLEDLGILEPQQAARPERRRRAR